MLMNPFSLQNIPAPNDDMGVLCRYILKHKQGPDWLTKAGHVCSVTDAWAAFQRSPAHPNNRSP